MRLFHGDCLEIMPALTGPVDAIIADLPYGTTACRWDTVIPLEPLWEQYKRLIKPRGAVVLFGSQPFTSTLVMSNVEWFRYCWVWEKTNAGDFMTAQIRPRKLHEDIVVFSGLSHNYFPQMKSGVPYIDKPRKRTNRIANSMMPKLGIINTGTRFPSSLIKFSNGNNAITHSAQKPVALLEYLIRTYTKPGETVLDNVMGSGTTGVACIRTGRHFIGIEKEQEYFEIAHRRIAQAQPPLFTELDKLEEWDKGREAAPNLAGLPMFSQRDEEQR